MRIYRIEHQIFEPDGPTPTVPIVIHVFQGASREEAEGYFRSHQTSDSFFAAAVAGRPFNGIRLESRSRAGWASA